MPADAYTWPHRKPAVPMCQPYALALFKSGSRRLYIGLLPDVSTVSMRKLR